MNHNETKPGVLLISDLHFSDTKYAPQKKICRFQDNDHFYCCFVDSIKKETNERGIQIKYCIVNGDVTENGYATEYDQALKILNKLCYDLSIDKNNVLITPGNHDFDRESINSHFRDKEIQPEDYMDNQHQSIVWERFAKFYSDFYDNKKHFCYNKAIIDILDASDMGVVFLGINSVQRYYINPQDQIGWIDGNALDNNLKLIQNESPKIAVMHYGMFHINEMYKIENVKDVARIFSKYHVTNYISAHAHTTDSAEIIQVERISYLIGGSLSKIGDDINNSYHILYNDTDKDQNTILRWECFVNTSDYQNEVWTKGNNESRIGYFTLIEKTGISAVYDQIKQVEKKGFGDSLSPFEDVSASKNLQIKINPARKSILQEGDDFLLKVIKDSQLYKSGHFHWSKTGATLSYIETDIFFNRNDYFEVIKECFISMIRYYKIEPELIIGYEMNGNMIGMLLAMEVQSDYTYLPAYYRTYVEYEEKPIPDKEYQHIAIVTDFVYKDFLIQNLVKQIKKEYPKTCKVSICTLFDGVEEIKEINENRMRSVNKYDNMIVNVYYIYQIPIIPCPAKTNDCLICNMKLTQVEKIYSDIE